MGEEAGSEFGLSTSPQSRGEHQSPTTDVTQSLTAGKLSGRAGSLSGGDALRITRV
jgi:hypothetical protein